MSKLPHVLQMPAAELAEVIEAYSRVTEQLRASHERLQSEVARLRAELQAKNRQLERRNRLAALGEMAAGMAHEIRNPLAGIQLYLDLLHKRLARDSRAAELAEKIACGVRLLERIVSEMLSFTKDLQLQLQRVSVQSIIDEALAAGRGQMQAHGIKAIVETSCRPCEITADPRLLAQAFLNIVLNAVEAMEDGGLLRIVVCRSNREEFSVLVRFIDNGCGIADELLEKIFNPFFTTRDTGTGLGLAIVHRIVEAHGGLVAASNNSPAPGATLSVWLP